MYLLVRRTETTADQKTKRKITGSCLTAKTAVRAKKWCPASRQPLLILLRWFSRWSRIGETRVLQSKETSKSPSLWKFDTLWEHPLGKGEATCHSSWLYSFMHRRYVEDYYKSSSLTHDANGREHSTCCGRNLCI